MTFGLLLLIFVFGSLLLPIPKNLFFYNGFGSMILAFGLFVYVLLQWNNSNKTLKSKFLGLPLLLVAYRFLILEFIWTVINYALATQVHTDLLGVIAIVLSVIFFGIGLTVLLASQVSINIVSEVEEKIKAKVEFIKTTQTEVELLALKTSDKAIQQKIKVLAEKIRFSDPISHPALSEIEQEITAKIIVLKTALIQNDPSVLTLIDEITNLIIVRNKNVLNKK